MAERAAWRVTAYRIIFGHDTPAGRGFDVALIVAILVSVVVVVVESVPAVRSRYGAALMTIEWGFTILFTIEYALRLACVRYPGRYATSFFGVIDLASILPTYLGLIFPATHYLLVIRILRVLRVFRILKLVEYVGEADVLMVAIRESRRKILVFKYRSGTNYRKRRGHRQQYTRLMIDSIAAAKAKKAKKKKKEAEDGA